MKVFCFSEKLPFVTKVLSFFVKLHGHDYLHKRWSSFHICISWIFIVYIMASSIPVQYHIFLIHLFLKLDNVILEWFEHHLDEWPTSKCSTLYARDVLSEEIFSKMFCLHNKTSVNCCILHKTETFLHFFSRFKQFGRFDFIFFPMHGDFGLYWFTLENAVLAHPQNEQITKLFSGLDIWPRFVYVIDQIKRQTIFLLDSFFWWFLSFNTSILV